MTRIIAGAARGRRLAVPARGTRPTSDRVREALFSSLESDLLARGLTWRQVSVLDLFAGTGALGLEALSRGARQAILVESGREASRVLADNVAAVDCPGARIVKRDATRLAGLPPPAGGVGLCFADPPYDVPAAAVRELLQGLADAGWLDEGADVIVERAGRDPGRPIPDAWDVTRRRSYGDTMLWYGRSALRAQARERDDDPRRGPA